MFNESMLMQKPPAEAEKKSHEMVQEFLLSMQNLVKKSPEHELPDYIQSLEQYRNLVPDAVLHKLGDWIESHQAKVDTWMQTKGDAKTRNDLMREIAEEMLEHTVSRYYDSRFSIPNDRFLMQGLADFVKEAKTEQNLSGTGMIFFDVDGLKATNDMALDKHTAGDKYLTKIAEVFTQGNTIQWLRSQGIDAIPARRSGDEFMMALRDQTGAFSQKENGFVDMDGNMIKDESLFVYVIRSIKNEVSKIDMQDVQDFSNKKQREEYTEIPEDAWPENFRFQASISGGEATIMDVLMHEEGLERDIFKKELHLDSISKFVGKMVDIADRRMKDNKSADKQKRIVSLDSNVRMSERIYRSVRTSEDAKKLAELLVSHNKLQEENDQLQMQYEQIKKELEELKRLRGE